VCDRCWQRESPESLRRRTSSRSWDRGSGADSALDAREHRHADVLRIAGGHLVRGIYCSLPTCSAPEAAVATLSAPTTISCVRSMRSTATSKRTTSRRASAPPATRWRSPNRQRVPICATTLRCARRCERLRHGLSPKSLRRQQASEMVDAPRVGLGKTDRRTWAGVPARLSTIKGSSAKLPARSSTITAPVRAYRASPRSDLYSQALSKIERGSSRIWATFAR
jgi:hypothetical protein